MTTLRFNFQRECAAKFPDGTILNVGANDDPANLKTDFGAINCDIITEHPDPPHYKYDIDLQFDCTTDTWPFADNSVDLVILGDIVEHLYVDELNFCLKECARVSGSVCITVPRDERINAEGYKEAIKGVQKGHVHVHVYDDEYLKAVLNDHGFYYQEVTTVDYDFCHEGYFILASQI